jgi:hypothetical protein
MRLRGLAFVVVVSCTLACGSASSSDGDTRDAAVGVGDGGQSLEAAESAAGDAANANGACATFSACGGDVVGTWVVSGACVVTAPPLASCAAGTVTMSMQVSGTVTFRADGTYAVNTMAGITEMLGVPASCLGGADCTSLQTSLQGQSGVSSAVCSNAPSSACRCTEVFTPQPNTDSGTYTVTGTSVMSPGAYAQPYCVQGTTIRWQDMNASGSVFVVTATKQL